MPQIMKPESLWNQAFSGNKLTITFEETEGLMFVQLNKQTNSFELWVTRELITLLTKNMTFPCFEPNETISRPSIHLLQD